jgi:hypothetical protein
MHPLPDGLDHQRDNILESPLKNSVNGRMGNCLNLTQERGVETLVATWKTCQREACRRARGLEDIIFWAHFQFLFLRLLRSDLTED